MSSVQRVNAVHELRVIRTRLKYEGVIQSWIMSDRQFPATRYRGNPHRLEDRAVDKANAMNNFCKGNP